MGDGRLTEAVADAGPLIHLAEIGCLDFLEVFNRVHVPSAVWAESVGTGRVPQHEVLRLNIMERHTVPTADVTSFVGDAGLEHLHAGEREALCLCRRIGVRTLLTDDLAVREAARGVGITPVGSLGVVIRACRTGHLSAAEAEHQLQRLQHTSSLFVTSVIVDLAVEQLRNTSHP